MAVLTRVGLVLASLLIGVPGIGEVTQRATLGPIVPHEPGAAPPPAVRAVAGTPRGLETADNRPRATFGRGAVPAPDPGVRAVRFALDAPGKPGQLRPVGGQAAGGAARIPAGRAGGDGAWRGSFR